MSRDGLLPRSLAQDRLHPRTPVRIPIIIGAAVRWSPGSPTWTSSRRWSTSARCSRSCSVSIGVLVLRKKRPDLKPAFRVPFGKVLPIVSAVLCLYLMTNLAMETWIFFAVWLVIGVVIYFSYGQRHSRLNEKFAEAKASVNGPADNSPAERRRRRGRQGHSRANAGTKLG